MVMPQSPILVLNGSICVPPNRRMNFGLKCAYAHGTSALRTHLINMTPKQLELTWPTFSALRAKWAGKVSEAAEEGTLHVLNAMGACLSLLWLVGWSSCLLRETLGWILVWEAGGGASRWWVVLGWRGMEAFGSAWIQSKLYQKPSSMSQVLSRTSNGLLVELWCGSVGRG